MAVVLIRLRVLGVFVGPQHQPAVLDLQAGQELERLLGAGQKVNLGRLNGDEHARLAIHLELAALGVTAPLGRRQLDLR